MPPSVFVICETPLALLRLDDDVADDDDDDDTAELIFFRKPRDGCVLCREFSLLVPYIDLLMFPHTCARSLALVLRFASRPSTRPLTATVLQHRSVPTILWLSKRKCVSLFLLRLSKQNVQSRSSHSHTHTLSYARALFVVRIAPSTLQEARNSKLYESALRLQSEQRLDDAANVYRTLLQSPLLVRLRK